VIRFICGCTSKVDEAAPLDDKVFSTFDAVILDSEDFLVCLVHHERRHGWRSVPYQAGRMLPGAEASWTPIEYERWLYWHEFPKRGYALELLPAVPDNRDNRDPQTVGQDYLDNRLVGNGP
jgi:hypothetical protein